ncbi:hypothetical protein ACF0H5_019686 [Mactra antiquata]
MFISTLKVMNLLYVFLVSLLSIARCDYQCLCSYSTQRAVYEQVSNTSRILGYMTKGECREIEQASLQQNTWASISFTGQIGYLIKDHYEDILTCTGQPPIYTTDTTQSTTVTSTTVSTTSSSVATTVSLDMSSSPQPTTARSTTVNGQTGCHARVLLSNPLGTVRTYSDTNNGKCFEFIPSRQTWSYAENVCRQHGGQLATISSMTQNTALLRFVQGDGHPTWIGLNDRNQEENFVWSSGEPLTFTNWRPGRQDPFLHVIQNCVAMGPISGTWEDIDCSNYYPYICEYDTVGGQGLSSNLVQSASTSATMTEGNTNLCPTSVVLNSQVLDNHILGQHGRYCYELITEDKVSWSNGERICSRYGGHLAYITDADEQGYIESFMKRHYPNHAVWIGLNDLKNEEHFEWTSGVPVTYTNWMPGRTSNFLAHQSEDCVVFVSHRHGQWDDIPCGQQSFIFGDGGMFYPILCQYDISNPTSNVLIG